MLSQGTMMDIRSILPPEDDLHGDYFGSKGTAVMHDPCDDQETSLSEDQDPEVIEVPQLPMPRSCSRLPFGQQRRLCAAIAATCSAAALVLAATGVSSATDRGLVTPGAQQAEELAGRPAVLLWEQQGAAGRRPCSFAAAPGCPAIELLSDPDIHKAATEALLSAGHPGPGLPRGPALLEAVAAGFAGLRERLGEQAPGAARQLATVTLNAEQKDNIMRCLQLLGDPHLRRIGLDVANAIRASTSVEGRPLRYRIEEVLRPQLKDLQALRLRLLPVQLRTMRSTELQWHMTLDLENLRLNRGPAGRALPPAIGLAAAVLEAARVLVHLVEGVARPLGVDARVPAAAVSLEGNLGGFPRDLSCGSAGGPFCRLRLASQGLEALFRADGPSSEITVAV